MAWKIHFLSTFISSWIGSLFLLTMSHSLFIHFSDQIQWMIDNFFSIIRYMLYNIFESEQYKSWKKQQVYRSTFFSSLLLLSKHDTMKRRKKKRKKKEWGTDFLTLSRNCLESLLSFYKLIWCDFFFYLCSSFLLPYTFPPFFHRWNEKEKDCTCKKRISWKFSFFQQLFMSVDGERIL